MRLSWGPLEANTPPNLVRAPGEEVYVDNIPGFEKPGYVIKLVRALYGLKQSPKHWADLLAKTLLELGYKRSDYDSCLYYYKDAKTNKQVFIACYVDDLLIVGDQCFIDQLVNFLTNSGRISLVLHIWLFN